MTQKKTSLNVVSAKQTKNEGRGRAPYMCYFIANVAVIKIAFSDLFLDSTNYSGGGVARRGGGPKINKLTTGTPMVIYSSSNANT
jgi:hypothetical protein